MFFKIILSAMLLFSSAQADKAALVGKIVHFITQTKPKKPLNYALRGKKHPKTGVSFSRTGYPRFHAVATCNMRLSWFTIQFDKFSSDASVRTKHFANCSKQLYKKALKDPKLRAQFNRKQLTQLRKGKTPDGYTWHHTPKKNTLQLVDRNTHAQTAHSGGFSLYH